MNFALVSDDDGRELATVSDVDEFFVARAEEPQTWRTFELLGCTSLKRGLIGNVELCVLDEAGCTIGAYYVGIMEVEDIRPRGELVDATVTGLLLSQPHPLAGAVWSQWRAGPPSEPKQWTPYDREGRAAWLEVVRLYRPRARRDDRPAGSTVVVDGRFVTDVPGLYLAIGEAVNGPGGYFGADPDGLSDCLNGGFGAKTPFTVEWTSADTALEAVGKVPLRSASNT